MLNLMSKASSHTCNGTTRRDFLQVGTLGAIGLGLPHYLAAAEQGNVDPEKDKRSCIMIFNLGAPSQLDTFDMKPEAAAEVRGPFKPISTKGDFRFPKYCPVMRRSRTSFRSYVRVITRLLPCMMPVGRCCRLDGSSLVA